MAKIICLIIKLYRYVLSPLFGSACRFYPSCSNYAEESIHRFGIIRGGAYTFLRLLKCHPFHPGGVDLVHEQNISSKS